MDMKLGSSPGCCARCRVDCDKCLHAGQLETAGLVNFFEHVLTGPGLQARRRKTLGVFIIVVADRSLKALEYLEVVWYFLDSVSRLSNKLHFRKPLLWLPIHGPPINKTTFPYQTRCFMTATCKAALLKLFKNPNLLPAL